MRSQLVMLGIVVMLASCSVAAVTFSVGDAPVPPENSNTVLAADPPSATFEQVEVGVQSATTVWNIMNTGDVSSSIPTLSQTTAELQVSGNTCTGAIPAGGSCSMTVGFKPSTGGARSGSLTLAVTGSSVTLTATATGMWRVTVQRNGTSGTITSSPAGISCPQTATSCFGLFGPGKITLLARTGNGSGVYFGAWSGASAGACANAPNRDCVLDVNGIENITGTFNAITSNLAFVSSAALPTNFGGVGPYDTKCNQFATAAGINNAAGINFIAWISDDLSNVLTRLGVATAASGWVRMDGRVFATSRTSLLGGAILNPVRYSETGVDLGEQALITGTSADGTTATTQNCNNWTSTNGSDKLLPGNSMGGPHSWTSGAEGSCSTTTTFRVLCMMRQLTTAPTVVTFPGKRVWLSNNPLTVSVTSSPDAVCNADRPSGVAIGKALLSRTTSTAASLIRATQMYVRPDGQEVGTGAEIIGFQTRGGIWQLGNGSYLSANSRAWTGAAALDQLGTAASTCKDWTDPKQTGTNGFAELSRNSFWNFTNQLCNATDSSQPRLYCYEP